MRADLLIALDFASVFYASAAPELRLGRDAINMIPATQKKLREAKFFLALLEQEERIPVWNANAEHAEFCFNALVSAGRSVTFAFQNEAKSAYDAWFPAWLCSRSEADRLALKRFNDERVKVVHRTGSALSSRNVLTPHGEVFPWAGDNSAAYIMARMRFPVEHAKVGTLQLVCQFSDDVEVVATDAARDYVGLLDSLVSDFVRDLRGAAQ